jgi:hypothetical protein
MNTPTLPHVSLPSVSLPDIPDVTHRVVHDVGERAGDVGGFVSDAWSTGFDKAQDLAAAAVDVLEDIPEKALALAGAVIPALRPSPKRAKRPFLIVAALVASLVVVAWIVKKRRAEAVESHAVPGSGPRPGNVSAAS